MSILLANSTSIRFYDNWESRHVDDLNKIKEFEVYDDEEPEYDSAGFTDEDRIVNGQYRVIDADMEAQDGDVFGDSKI
jgi:hypothetical protein